MHTLKKLLTKREVEFCKRLLTKYETPGQIRAVIPITDLGKIGTKIRRKIQDLCGPFILGAADENVNILRYPTGSSMPMHKDVIAIDQRLAHCTSHLFLSVALTDDFTGGILINDNEFSEKQKNGDGVIFDGNKFHMVSQIMSGERIVLLVFIHTLT